MACTEDVATPDELSLRSVVREARGLSDAQTVLLLLSESETIDDALGEGESELDALGDADTLTDSLSWRLTEALAVAMLLAAERV